MPQNKFTSLLNNAANKITSPLHSLRVRRNGYMHQYDDESRVRKLPQGNVPENYNTRSDDKASLLANTWER